MVTTDQKADLQRYLQTGREALLWKLEGLSEYDIRRPVVPTGTNLLGLVKHVASVELGYFADTFDRPSGISLPCFEEGAEPNADMWATPEETRADIVELYHRTWAHTDRVVAEFDLDAVGSVPWWPADRRDVTLHRVLVHVIAETYRHAGHADLVRELVDGSAGLRADNGNLPEQEQQWWIDYRRRLQAAAESWEGPAGPESDLGRPTA